MEEAGLEGGSVARGGAWPESKGRSLRVGRGLREGRGLRVEVRGRNRAVRGRG